MYLKKNKIKKFFKTHLYNKIANLYIYDNFYYNFFDINKTKFIRYI